MSIDKPYLLFVSGFGWSGSGAVIDYLRGFKEIKQPDCDEIRFINHLFKIINNLKKNISAVEIEDLFCAKINPKISSKTSKYFELKFDLFFKEVSITKEEYQNYSSNILEQLKNSYKDDEKIKELVTDYLIYISKAFNKQYLYIFDNVVPARDLQIFKYIIFDKFQSIVLYVVDRDPKDQFYEVYELANNNKPVINWPFLNSIIRFFNKFGKLKIFFAAIYFAHFYYKKPRLTFKADMDFIYKSGISQVRYIQFENFVNNKDQIWDLIDQDMLIFFNIYEKGNDYFYPEVSMKNIGKYKKIKNKIVLKYIDIVTTYPLIQKKFK
jgi:hypothetical protein